MAVGRLIISTLIVVAALFASGCSNDQKSPNGSVEAISQETSSVTTDSAVDGASSALNDARETADDVIDAASVRVGDTVNVSDVFEIRMDSFEWVDEVTVGDPDGFYFTPAMPVEGMSYFVIHGSIKNNGTGKESLSYILDTTSQTLIATYLFNNTYSIEAEIIVDTGDGGYDYSISPLQTAEVIVYGSVSNEIKDQFECCDVTFSALELGSQSFKSIPVGICTMRFE